MSEIAFTVTIKKVDFDAPTPNGWRLPTTPEVQHWKDQIVKILQQWSIVAFDGGKIDGHGYGNVITV